MTSRDESAIGVSDKTVCTDLILVIFSSLCPRFLGKIVILGQKCGNEFYPDPTKPGEEVIIKPSSILTLFDLLIYELDEHDQTALAQPELHQRRTLPESSTFIVSYQNSTNKFGDVHHAVFIISLKK